METVPPPLDAIINYLQQNYQPCHSYTDADVRISTDELHEKLQAFFPLEGFTPAILFTWLIDMEYKYEESGHIKPEWLLKRKV